MSEHFIKNIEIKNFKCFEDFKAEGFGRVNLIGGKNNVGKTAFMEACYPSSSSGVLNLFNAVAYLVAMGYWRGAKLLDDKFNLDELLKVGSFTIKTNCSKFDFQYSTDMLNNIVLKFNGEEEKVTYEDRNNLLRSVVPLNFIPSVIIGDNLIISIFDKIKEQRKRQDLNKILNEFDQNVLEFDIIDDTPQVFLESKQEFQDVAELGHGLKRYITLISSILINKDGFLFLDEIENGIHYTNLDKLWEIILTISKQQNVQVFATTHSKECIESYARVAEQLQDEEITFFKLGKNQEGEIKGMVYPYEWFVDSVEQEEELRGW